MDADWVNGGFVIRGVNSEGFASGSAPIGALYVDGILQTQDATRRGALGLWDMEQVEVYRGPQSTLSGRAAMAGAIYLKSKDPTFERQAEISGTAGTDDLVDTAVMFNAPLIDDQLAVRLAAEFERSKSDINYPTYTEFDRYDDLTTALYYNIRGKVLYQPSEMPDTKALLTYSFTHDSPNDRDIGGPAAFPPRGPYDWDDDRGDINDPQYTEPRETDVHNVGLEITHDFSDALRLTALTGFNQAKTDRSSVNFETPGETDYLEGYRDDMLVSQEVRLNYEGDRWKWVGGLYASYQDLDNWFDRYGVSARKSRTEVDTTNLAAFGEATYEFIPTWKVTAGGRLDYTAQDYRDISWTEDANIKETHFLPKVGISKDFNENHTVGVFYSEGFRTGGNGFDYFTNKPYTYEPEKAQNFELFYKGTMLDDRLTLNANIFYTKFKDQQVEIIDINTFNIVTGNAASSRSYGFEIEPTFQVTDELSAFVSLGYLNTKFDEESAHYLVDLAGYPFPEAPEWSIAAGARYQFTNGFYVGGDVKYTSDYMARLSFSPPNDFVGSRTIANIQAGYKAESWEINAFAENVLDERYFTYMDDNAYATVGPGRTVGLNVKARF